VTNLPLPAKPGARARVELADGRELRLAASYSDVAPGELLALRGSSGLLEIARRDGSAARALGAGRGLVVILRAV
jgi:S-adenosylmethionine hydrolase